MKNSHTSRLWANTRVRPYIFCLFTLYSSLFILHSQNVAINATGNQADPSAMLDVSSTSAGVLIPRMTMAQRNLITSPAIGLQVFNTDCNELNYWNGTCWIAMGSLPDPAPVTSNSSTGLCALSTATYSIPAVTGATRYDWSVPAVATINSGQGTTSISVTWGNYSGEVCVKAQDACETSNPTCLDVNINPIPPTPGNITGLASVSPGQTGVTYFIAAVSGAGAYTWSVPAGATITSGTGTPAITVSFACNAVSGNVSVTAGSNCGNSSPSVLAVTVTPLIVNAGSSVFSGVAIGGSPTASAGQTPYTYSWSPNSNLSSYTVANPTALCSGSNTTYTITVTDFNGCSATSSVAVTRNLAANAGSAIYGGGALSGTATGGVFPYAYSWSPNSNLSGYGISNPTAQCSGSTTTYTLTVTDAHGCTATSGVAVTRNLAANAGANNAICPGNSAAIGPATATGGNNSSYTYSWNPSTGLSSTTIANPTANPASTATYTVTVTDANGCTATSSMTLTVNTLPVSTFTNSSPAEVNTAITFSPATTSGVTYSWTFTGGSPGTSTAQNPSVTWSSTGNYNVSLTVTSTSTGCSSSTSNAITIVNPTIISFTNIGTTTWTAPSGVSSIQILVVAGGGSGGAANSSSSNDAAGGGGAGGLVYNSSLAVVPNQAYSVTVGAGGTGVVTNSNGNNGGNSSFGSLITAIGGGGGGAELSSGPRIGGTGGSGGGAGGYSGTGGSGTSGQGNNGGNCTNNGGDGGGGGAGAAGTSGTNNSPNNAGGAGLSYSISGTPTYYAGGGGGAGDQRLCSNGLCEGPGGTGGGGAGAPAVNGGTATNGTPNTGGGGGGAAGGHWVGSAITSGSGGSGIVIIEY